MSQRKNSKEVIKYAQDEGYTVTPTKGGHWKAMHPNGALVILSNTTNGNYANREMDRLRKEKRRRTEQ
jgi:predicted RNA binding protein YcfA (HicA-like mRNA interferase family)